jgi:hypothetical protein
MISKNFSLQKYFFSLIFQIFSLLFLKKTKKKKATFLVAFSFC